MADTSVSMAPAARPVAGPMWKRAALALFALLLAAAAAAGLFPFLGGMARPLPDWLMIAAAALALIGAAALLAWLAGWVRPAAAGAAALTRQALDACPEGCVITGPRGRIRHANAAWRALSEKAGRKRLAGPDILFAPHPDVAQAVYRLHEKARDGAHAARELFIPAGQEVPGFTNHDGLWLRLEAVPMGAGAVLWRVADVSAEHARHDAAFADLQHVIDYLDNMPAGLFSTTDDGRVTYVNATLGDWLGLDSEQSMGRGLKLTDLMPPEVATRLAAIEPQAGETRTETLLADLCDATGREFPVRLVHRVDFDAAGRPRPSRTLVLDLRDPAQEDDAGALKLARFIHAAPLGIALTDGDGTMTALNAALARLSDKARSGARLRELVAGKDHPQFIAAWESVVSGTCRQARVEVDIDAADPVRAQLTLTRVSEGDGKEPELAVYVLDTSHSRRLQEQLEQSRKMQEVGTLVSGIAHDFNNKLTVILGAADFLLARHRPEDPSFVHIRNIRHNAAQSADMVRQLLAFSRKQTLQPRVLTLSDLVAETGAMLKRTLGEKVEVKIEHGRDLWPVKADPTELDRVIMNLAVNARDAMPGGGRLTIRTANLPAREAARVAPDIMPAADYVLLEVADEGEGIPPEVRERIFDPFFTTKEVGKGTGLGMSMVFGIVKQSGGYIFCDSAPGEGTTFRIYLPRHVETAEERGQRLEEERRAAKAATQVDLTGKGLILLVEDEDAVREFALRALTQRGYEVMEAASAELALDLMEEMREEGRDVDLIVSDVVMPGMDGPTMIRELRQLGVAAPVVFMSGHAEDAFAENLEEGMEFTFLAKPFTLKDIAATVKRAMTGA
ncbi:MAG TPA: response regulator [Thermopetrobacter sp.]|nr:response regulator [Thermopetrobacter sp.]